MHIDRYMVNLFFEIRRNLQPELQEDLKIADPKVADKLIHLFHSNDDDNIKRLIEVFFDRAGDDWPQRLIQKKRFYRGAVAAPTEKNNQPANKNNATAQKATKPKRIYRGRVVED